MRPSTHSWSLTLAPSLSNALEGGRPAKADIQYSVYEKGAPHVDWTQLSQLDIPILGICYGLQEIAWHHDNKNVLAGEKREYGHAKLRIEKHKGEAAHVDKLFNGLGNDLDVWMSHGKKYPWKI
ncbi:GMP synthase (glutamine-hydrolyzing) [Lepraria neglecta]|uniref:GMP synthase (Glutamine-hydrolyzing) n=1 Tax=Lepraria neglecta TaxID=209136 RepID=A0AAD9ZB88_9LECA|nr:GMP synthase (glutamine-hydrolyzing) [Lepraria neglecta]